MISFAFTLFSISLTLIHKLVFLQNLGFMDITYFCCPILSFFFSGTPITYKLNGFILSYKSLKLCSCFSQSSFYFFFLALLIPLGQFSSLLELSSASIKYIQWIFLSDIIIYSSSFSTWSFFKVSVCLLKHCYLSLNSSISLSRCVCVCVCVCVCSHSCTRALSHSVVSNSLQPHGL